MVQTPGDTAVNILWMVFYATWLAGVVWSGKTKTQMKTDMRGLHRAVSGIGVMLLFTPWGYLADRWPSLRIFIARLWPAPDGLQWGLFALIVLGFAFCWWARLHLGRLWSGFVTLKEDHRVVDTGPYGLVRHPIYTGIMIAGFATALMRASPLALAGASLITIGFSMTARIEEGFLRAQLGDAYDAYSRRVGMLVPRMG